MLPCLFYSLSSSGCWYIATQREPREKAAMSCLPLRYSSGDKDLLSICCGLWFYSGWWSFQYFWREAAEMLRQSCRSVTNTKQFYSLALYFLLSTLSCCPTNICWRKSCLGATLNLQTVYINCDTTHWCLDLAFWSKGIGCSHIGLPFCCLVSKAYPQLTAIFKGELTSIGEKQP